MFSHLQALLERFVSPFMCQFAIRLAKVLRPARHHLRTASRHIASLPFITWVDAAIARVWTKPQRRMQRPYGAMDSDVYQRTQSGKGTKDMRASTAASQKGSSHSGSDSSMVSKLLVALVARDGGDPLRRLVMQQFYSRGSVSGHLQG